MHASSDTWGKRGSFRSAIGALLLLPTSAVAGCSLDIHPGESDTTGGSPPQGSGEGGAVGAGGAGGGTGGDCDGHVEGDFALSIKPAEVRITYERLNHIDVEITRLDGFDGPVEVAAKDPPEGFVAAPLTVPAGASEGRLEVSALGPLEQDTAFDLELIATSGTLARSASVPAVVVGEPGTFDTRFGAGGTSLWAARSQLIRLGDIREVEGGKILIAGEAESSLDYLWFLTARLLPDGALDPSFGSAGQVRTSFCSCLAQNSARGVLRKPDGTVLVTGSGQTDQDTPLDLATVRLRDDGTPDSVSDDGGGDDGGKTLLDLGGRDVVIAAEPSGPEHFLVTGAHDDALFVARVGSFSLDQAGFGAPNGWVLPDIGGTASLGTALDIDEAGRIVVAGRVEHGEDGGFERDIVVLRLTPSGELDPGFGDGGVVTLDALVWQDPVAVAIQPDGRVVLASSSHGAETVDLLLVRLDATGGLDPTFGAGGSVVTPVSWGDDVPIGMELLQDGRIVVAGNTTEDPFVARFLPDGSLDPEFDADGILLLRFDERDTLQAMALGQRDKLLVAGTIGQFSMDPGGYKGFVARLWN